MHNHKIPPRCPDGQNRFPPHQSPPPNIPIPVLAPETLKLPSLHATARAPGRCEMRKASGRGRNRAAIFTGEGIKGLRD